MIKRIFLALLVLGAAQAPVQAHGYFSGTSLHVLLSLWMKGAVAQQSLSHPEEISLWSLPQDPVIAFSAERAGEGALLKWDIPRPADVSNLIIEGSEDGSHFIDLESLENTEAGVLDLFYDAAPKDRRYYRIIANYKDGRQKTTPVSTLPPTTAFSAEVDVEEDNVLMISGWERVELYDMQGQLITTADPVDGKCVLGLHGLAAGSYLARCGENRQIVFL